MCVLNLTIMAVVERGVQVSMSVFVVMDGIPDTTSVVKGGG